VIRNIRLLGAALGGLVGLTLAGADGGLFRDAAYAGALLATWVVAWVIVGFAILPYLTLVPAAWLITRVEALSTAEFVTAVIGLILGLLMGLLLGIPLNGLPDPFGQWLPLGVSLFLGLGMLGLTVAKRKDLLLAAETVGLIRRPVVDGQGVRRGDPHIVVDTSAIIDGRIAEIVESGFIYGTLVVPRFVLEELQHIADSSDTLRRNRGRRGLEILNRMQKDATTPVEIVEDDVPDVPEVDAKLVALARERSRVILTNDFNLNRVAELQGVRVMNINSLANAVKPAVLPGEELRVRVIQEGSPHRPGPGRVGHPRPPDRRRPDDLRPAATRLSPADARLGCRGRDRRRGRQFPAHGWPGQARLGGGRATAPRLYAGRGGGGALSRLGRGGDRARPGRRHAVRSVAPVGRRRRRRGRCIAACVGSSGLRGPGVQPTGS
jgi:uncharacterized protein YacL